MKIAGYNISVGHRRILIRGPKYTAKIPRFNLRATANEFIFLAKEKHWKSLKIFVTAPERVNGSLRDVVLRGIASNIREARFSSVLKCVVVPTRFSFLGLLNIQDTPSSHQFEDALLWRKFKEEIGSTLFAADHIFANPAKSFGIHQGKLKITDYGRGTTLEMLIMHQRKYLTVLDELSKSLDQTST